MSLPNLGDLARGAALAVAAIVVCAGCSDPCQEFCENEVGCDPSYASESDCEEFCNDLVDEGGDECQEASDTAFECLVPFSEGSECIDEGDAYSSCNDEMGAAEEACPGW